MSRVTSKLQVTIPKALATRYGIAPGDEIAFVPAGDSIRIVLQNGAAITLDREAQLAMFDEATRRQQSRNRAQRRRKRRAPGRRGWTREELYQRGRTG